MGDQRRSTIERALELARSGKVGSLQELRQALKREGFADGQAQLQGLGFKRQLQEAIRLSRQRPSEP